MLSQISNKKLINRDAPDIQPDNPAFYDIGIRPNIDCPAGYPVRPDTGYPANG
jgi:hypothetical protein